MQFKVPQFIDQESKIFGPLTLKQFIFLAISGSASLILYFYLEDNLFLWLVISGLLIGFSLTLTLLQVEGIPLYIVIGKSFNFFLNQKRYFWKKKDITPKIALKKTDDDQLNDKAVPDKETKRTGKSRINELWSDIETK